MGALGAPGSGFASKRVSMTESYLHFDGDPQTDSARRHMERVLTNAPRRRRWPWVVGLLAGGGSWTIWRAWQKSQAGRAEHTKQS